ncbi:uncharacterized protein I303_105575 [Kwoniella dejecticola CBS 10117]|uniref:Uncharacterized protein n=1 Tax=Kwoniella dejecticola CBS 10117 TaxID=1296121 RepID=A0A1A6A235_9TREE|nr:uncharacterized protein I303_04982 [Kwoniella dejecticola CBS 10117]OBR84125.1 hypothetical protein I303_04982 [Kwoniella dejecticola CBS 10117]
MPVPSIIPSSFLPPLPRNQYTLVPLLVADILARISILKELYLPPIHGGFTSADVFDDEDEASSGKQGRKVVRKQKRERRFSAGLVETMDSIGLGLDVSLDSRQAHGLEVLVEEDQLGKGDQELEVDSEDSDAEDLEDIDAETETDAQEHLDPFEREWSEKWLGGIIRRSQNWLEENSGDSSSTSLEEVKDMEVVLRDATAVLAMMAGTSAAGSLTRHLVFPLLPSLAPALALQSRAPSNPALSPETNTFLASLATSPTSPKVDYRGHFRRSSNASTVLSSSPTNTTSMTTGRKSTKPRAGRQKQAVLPILLHDAPMGDHLSVGVQTWGSAILLGRRLALNPQDYGLFPSISATTTSHSEKRDIKVLELGAGTGLLSILCKKLLDLRAHSMVESGEVPGKHLVVATDFLKSVLDNLKICVDLNFPNNPMTLPNEKEKDADGETGTSGKMEEGIHIAKLDWTTFPTYMQSKGQEGSEELAPFLKGRGKEGFDLVLASDCVYDETHAKLLREVVGWTLKLPDANGENGGTFHILSPLRPTFAPELESIDTHFPPLSTYPPLSTREEAAAAKSGMQHAQEDKGSESRGEGLGLERGLKIGTRGEGKRGVKGRKGEGRVDEGSGYWWWEVGWG